MYVLLIISLFNIIFIRNREGFFVGASGILLSLVFIIGKNLDSPNVKSILYPIFFIAIMLFVFSLIYTYIKTISSYRRNK